MDHLHLDWETRSACDLIKTGTHIYAQDPTTEVLLASYAFDDERVENWFPGEPIPDRIDEHIKKGLPVWAHNAPFELLIGNYTAVTKYKWPAMKPEQMVCTMAMALSMGLPPSLEKAAAAVGISEQKDMAGSRLMLQMSKPRKIEEDGTIVWWDSFEKMQALAAYGRQDVVVERLLGKRLLQLSPFETQVWQLDYLINSRGICVDVESARKAIKVVDFVHEKYDEEMRRITNNQVATCSANKQLKDWINSRGVETDGVAKDHVNDLLSRTLPSDVRTALILRRESAKSSTAKLETLANGTGDDSRIRGLFQYHAASTGRWGGRRFQPQNLPRPNLDLSQINEVFKLMGELHA